MCDLPSFLLYLLLLKPLLLLLFLLLLLIFQLLLLLFLLLLLLFPLLPVGCCVHYLQGARIETRVSATADMFPTNEPPAVMPRLSPGLGWTWWQCS